MFDYKSGEITHSEATNKVFDPTFFKKLVRFQGGSPWSLSAESETLLPTQNQDRRVNSPVDCLLVGDPIRGVSRRACKKQALKKNTYQKVKRAASKRSCALSFYINSLLIQDLHKLFAGDGLFLIQELCKLVELRAVLLQNPHRLRVLLLHKVNHLSVDLCLRFGAARQ